MVQQIRVLVVDYQVIIRAGLSSILDREPDISIIGEAKDCLEAIAKALELNPDVILMNTLMPHCDGLTALKTIKECIPRVKVLMISEREDDGFQALEFGAEGYLLNSATIAEVAGMVRDTANGKNTHSSCTAEFTSNSQPKVVKPKMNERGAGVIELNGERMDKTEVLKRYQHILYVYSSLCDEDNGHHSQD